MLVVVAVVILVVVSGTASYGPNGHVPPWLPTISFLDFELNPTAIYPTIV